MPRFSQSVIATVIAFSFSGGSSIAATKTIDKLADSALTSALRSSDAAGKNRQLAAAQLQIQTNAAQFPSALNKAKVVLGRGYSAAELQKLVTLGSLELTQVEAKVAVPGSDEVYTVILAGTSIEQADGNVTSRLKAAQLTTQQEFAKLAVADADLRAKYTALSRNPLLFYSFESIGTNASLAAIGQSADVRVVQPLQSPDALGEASNQQSIRQSMHEIRSAKASGGRIASVAPCQNRLSAIGTPPTTNATPVCPEEPENDPPLPSTPVPSVSGETFIDSAMAGANQFIDGSNDSGGSGPGKIQLPADLFFPCDSTQPNQRCPSDYAYTTRWQTGGKFAWGVGVQQTGGPQGGYVCGLVYHLPTNDTSGYYTWECWWVVVDTPKWTYATTAVQMKFGGNAVSIPRWVQANVADRFALSTFAWSGVGRTLGGGPSECQPTGSWLDVARPCQGYARDANFVVGQTGFEDKILIPNPNCHTTLGRTGASTDKNNGCFTPDRVITNLPTPYLDTTFMDADNLYTASVGVVDGKLLTGIAYQVRIEGSAKGWESVRGLTVRHVQAVTAWDSAGAPCITGVGGAPAGGGAACMFNVDQSYVGADGVFR